MTEHVNRNNITGFEIAIIGMSGRFPGADSIEKLWQNLTSSVESISYFTEEELKAAGVTSGLPGEPDYTKAGAILEDTDAFDAYFFGYSPREAQLMVPQMRLFHECVWQALEDAGYDPWVYPGDIGLYAGASSGTDWEVRTYLSGQGDKLGVFHTQMLVNRDQLCTRISYNLNLKGPSVFVQTACSTSLVSVHLACQGLLSGECDMALAGAVSLFNTDRQGYLYQEGGIYSPDGHCRSFDADAKGSVPGEGLGVVVLKSLENALADGDNIHAVIKSSAINNDGNRKVGYTAPSAQAQAAVVADALRAAEVEPESIAYIETHGTGTPVGDPIEIEALKMAFNTKKKQFCQIGSVKTNVGHLIEVAGITGLIKAALVLKHRLIPPNLHYKKQNPRIDFENSPFVVNTELYRLERGKYPLRAGVSSFGIGGTNAHVILEEAPIAQSAERKASPAGPLLKGALSQGRGGISPPSKSRQYQLILLSAKIPSALDQMSANLADYFKRNPDINMADVAYTLQVGRTSLEYRRQLVCANREQAVELLSNPDSREMRTHYLDEGSPPVVFMFPGLGAQYVDMGLGLYQSEPLFRQEMDRCFQILETLMGYDIKEILYPGRGEVSSPSEETPATCNRGLTHLSPDIADINQPEIAQVVIFIFEYALAKLLMNWGIMPRSMIGYSFGEYAAACIAGVFSLEDALRLVVSRGLLIEETVPGSMLSVPLTAEELKPMLKSELSLAIDNGPSCIVSGSISAVEAFEKRLKEKRHICIRLLASRAIHSALMESILEKFENTLEGIQLNIPKIPYLSNVTGTWMTDEDAADPQYWVKHLRQTVCFAQGVGELLKEPYTVFIEVGPGRDLNTLMARHLEKDAHQQVVDLVRHPGKKAADTYYLLSKIGRLWLYGQQINWKSFYINEKRRRVSLPVYPFEKQHWEKLGVDITPGTAIQELTQKTTLVKKADISQWFYIPAWKRSLLLSQRDPISLKKQNDCWLVFTDRVGWGSRLAQQLEIGGASVIRIDTGDSFQKVTPGTYTINPREKDHYHTLMQELVKLEKSPAKVLHLWSIDACPGKESAHRDITAESFAGIQAYGLYSLLYLVQAIDGQGIKNDLEIFVITNQAQEVTGGDLLFPENASIISPVKTIPQEYPNIKCRAVDIQLQEAGLQEDRMVERLLEELTSGSMNLMTAYRNNYRWVQVFEPISMQKNHGEISRLQEKGVYLVTGGLGNIGSILSGYLAEYFKARLILIGRSPLPPRTDWEQVCHTGEKDDPIKKRILKVRELEKKGGEVLYFSVDVADKEQMQEVVTRAEERYGSLNGVIHTAGTFEGETFQPLHALDKTHCEMHFQSKVYGLLVLEQLLRPRELDFCLLTSSLSPILGGLGFSAYAAANLFIDAFIHTVNRTSPTPWISVNWADWEFPSHSRNSLLGAGLARLNITPEQGIETFKRILSYCKGSQVAVSAGDLQVRLNQWVNLEILRTEKDRETKDPKYFSPRKDLMSSYVAPRNPLEQALVEIWQELFGIAPIGIQDNFFELGGDSLLGITLINRLKELLGEIVHITVIFEANTIEQLSVYIVKHYPQAASGLMGTTAEKLQEYRDSSFTNEINHIDRGTTSQLLEQIDQFSDQKVDEMLKEILNKETKNQ